MLGSISMAVRDEVVRGLRAEPVGSVAAGSAAPEVATRLGKSRCRVALFGLFGSGNFGNDASLEAMLETLRTELPDAELVCICHDGDVIARHFGIATLPISGSPSRRNLPRTLNRLFLKIPGKLRDFAHSLRTIRSFQAMIIPGTGMLDDFGDRPQGMPLNVFRWCLAARLCGVKVAFVSIGAGPIGHPVSRWLMLFAARLANYRSYRDEISRDFMAGLGLDTGRDPVFPDIVFKLPARVRKDAPERTGGRTVVGLGVMNYRGWYGFAAGGEQIYADYIGKLVEFVVYLLDSGYDVRLLIGDLDDEDAVDIVLRRLRSVRPDIPDGRLLADRCHSLHDVADHMAGTDFVVGTRYHNIVCALKLGKPTISLGYARKNDVLMAGVGMGALCHHVERFEVPALIDQFADLVAHRAEYERRIRGHTASFVEALERQDKILLRDLLPRGAYPLGEENAVR